MIKFVRKHSFILIGFVLSVSLLTVIYINKVNAAGINLSVVSEMSPIDQIASSSYAQALKSCIANGQYNNTFAGESIDLIFAGQTASYRVGYIAKQVAIKNGIAANPDYPVDMQCQTIAKAAFKLWGLYEVDINTVFNILGFTKTTNATYKCLARFNGMQVPGTDYYIYDVDKGVDGNYAWFPSFTLPIDLGGDDTWKNPTGVDAGILTGIANDTMQLNPLANPNSDDQIDLSELKTFCDYAAQSKPAPTYSISTSSVGSFLELDGDTITWSSSSADKPVVKYISSLYSNKDPSIYLSPPNAKGLDYLLNKYYFEAPEICGAINLGKTSIFFADKTTTEIENIKNGGIDGKSYVEVKLVENATTGSMDTYSYTMPSDKVNSEDKLALWTDGGTTFNTSCKSVRESLGTMAATISGNIIMDGDKTGYIPILAGGVGTITAGTISQLDATDKTDSCGAQVAGVGWIMCPILNGLVGLNDGVWRLVTGLLTVSPLQQQNASGEASGAYVAWGMIRNIANIVFVIIFLVMIFSQLSSAGISNYGIKKLLPRLIVGAILVNISFLIIQLAVDLSNIIGNGLYGLIQGVTPYAPPGWATLFNQISIGAIGAAAVGAATLFAAGNATAFWMLLPIAAVGLLGLIAAIITLVFRKAAIIILAIFAPLAIVASLLPNTESWFKKWKDEFIQLLMLYPLAAVIFGGSQFAASIIMSENPNSWFNNLMAMVITTLPLFSLPFLVTKGGKIMSTAGGALSKLAEKARNPIKSMAKSYEDEARAKYLAGDPSQRRTSLGRWQQSTYKRFQGKRKTRELNTKTDTEGFNSQWAGSTDAKMGDGFGANQRSQLSKDDAEKIQLASQDFYKKSVVGKQAIDDIGKLKMDIKVDDSEASTRLEKNEGLLNLRMKVKAGEAAYKAATDATSLIATEAATKSNAAHLGAIDYGTRKILQDSKRSSDLINIASNNAQRVQQSELADTLIKNIDLEGGRSVRDFAGGIDTEKGANSALANAIATKREAHNKVVTERNQMIKHFNVDGTGRQALSMGKQVRNKDTGVMEDVKGKDIDGNEFVFKQGDINTQEAAIETQMTIGSFPEFSEIIEASGEGEALHAFRTVIADAIPKNGINKKGPEFGGKFINKVSQGKAQGHKSTVIGAAEFLLDGKFQPEDMANSDGLSLKNMIEAATLYDKIDTATGKPYIPEFNLDDNGQIKKDANGNNINNYTVMKERIKKLKAIADLVLDPKTTVGKNRTDTATEQFEIMSKLGSNDNQEDYNI